MMTTILRKLGFRKCPACYDDVHLIGGLLFCTSYRQYLQQWRGGVVPKENFPPEWQDEMRRKGWTA